MYISYMIYIYIEMIASTDWMSQHRHREIFYGVGGSFVAELLCQYFSI